ncbi:MAG: TauD/TfdA family dioxygenase [Acidimicrobiales bacterium]
MRRFPTPDFEWYPTDPAAVAASLGAEGLHVTWADGHSSAFHPSWLRDNCACTDCIDPVSRERAGGFLDMPAHPAIDEVAVDEGGVRLRWRDGHVSEVHPGWLRHFDYVGGARPSAPDRDAPWSADAGIPSHSAAEFVADHRTQHRALSDLVSHGLVVLTDLDPDMASFEALVARVGLIRNMNWAPIFEIDVNDEPYIANRTGALEAHSDASTRDHRPGVVVFHAIENTVVGGESFFVDCRHVARLLRDEDPSAHNLLATVPLEFANRSLGTHYRTVSPVLTLDADGDVESVCDTVWLREPLRIDPDLMGDFYAAYRRWSEIKADPANQVEHQVIDGEVMLIDNLRVMHGRRAFDATNGRRRIRTAYVDREELLSSVRLHRRRVHSSAV